MATMGKGGVTPPKGVQVPSKMTAGAAGGLGRLEKSMMAPKPGSVGPKK